MQLTLPRSSNGLKLLCWSLAAHVILSASGAEVAGKEALLAARGKAITQEAFQLLSSNLKQALLRGGVSEALPYCSLQAGPLTRQVAKTNDVVLRRVSHNPRNPKNRADEVEAALLKRFLNDLSEGHPPQPVVVWGDSGQAVYFAPIILNNPLCLKCHGQPGTDIGPADLATIRELYPQDKATGFKLGELRGMWRVDFKPATRPEPEASQ